MVAVITAAPSTHQLLVHTQGTIDAKRRVDLVSQVAGKVVAVSEAFADGGFFKKGDFLLSALIRFWLRPRTEGRWLVQCHSYQ